MIINFSFSYFFKGALIGIFDQILGEDETLREKAIEYVSVPLMDMRHVLFIPKEENEKCLLELIKKVTIHSHCNFCRVLVSPF